MTESADKLLLLLFYITVHILHLVTLYLHDVGQKQKIHRFTEQKCK